MNGLSLVALAGVAALACSQSTELIAARAAQCMAPGPAIHLGGTGDAACSGAIAAQAGRYALCSCNDLNLKGNLWVGSAQSAGQAQMPGPGPNGPPPRSFFTAVGTDGAARVPGLTDINGTFLAAGVGDVQFAHGGHIQGNVRAGGNLVTMSMMGFWISGDAYAAGDVSGRFVVNGPLHVPGVATVNADVQSGGVAREAVSVTSPCGCDATPAFDVAAAVAARAHANDNQTLSFTADVLAGATTTQTLDWPCGEYYLPELRSDKNGALEFRIHGRVGLFVAGDVRLGDNLNITLDPGAELDLVVAGSFYTTGLIFGSPATPARTRLWVGSTVVSLPDQIQLGAAVYAPGAVFTAGGGLAFSGSLFVGTLLVDGDVRITYDPAVTLGGQACGLAPPARVE
jgi:hypothetical protein